MYSVYSVMGYHTQSSIETEAPKLGEAHWFNFFQVLGYIPLIGSINGLARSMTACQENLEKSAKICLLVRGILEILGLGLLFLIPDAIVSVHRHCGTPSQQVSA